MVGFPKPGKFTLKLLPMTGTYAEYPRSASVSCLSVQPKYLTWIYAENEEIDPVPVKARIWELGLLRPTGFPIWLSVHT
jgi:hypothetical protein